MRLLWVAFKTDINILVRGYKKILLFMIQMVILCFGIGVLGSSVLSQNKDIEPFSVGVVDLETSELTQMITEFIGNMDTVSELCKIQMLEEGEAKEKLHNREIVCIITVPEGFMEGIMYGDNIPISIEKYEGTIVENIVIDALVDAATDLLSASQVGIYTGLDAYEEFGDGDNEEYDQLMRDINIKFIQEMITRNDIFDIKKVSATNDLTPVTYYMLSGFVMMTLLSLILVRDIIKPMNNVHILMRYRVMNAKISEILIGKILAITLYLMVIGGSILTILIVGSKCMGMEIDITLSFSVLIGGFLAAGSIAAICIFIGLILKDGASYSLFLFIIVLIMTFISGGIIPEIYLPEIFSSLKWMSLNTYIMEMLKPLFGLAIDKLIYINIIIITLVLVGICIQIVKRKEHKH